jgi:hypothetical protein
MVLCESFHKSVINRYDGKFNVYAHRILTLSTTFSVYWTYFVEVQDDGDELHAQPLPSQYLLYFFISTFLAMVFYETARLTNPGYHGTEKDVDQMKSSTTTLPSDDSIEISDVSKAITSNELPPIRCEKCNIIS